MSHTPLEKQLFAALKAISTNKHLCLEDKIYDVRESEGKGWDGPSVKAWGKALKLVEEAIDAYEGTSSQA